MPGFTKKEVSKITGLNPRQVQFYTEQGVVIPAEDRGEGRGKARRYSMKNLADFALIQHLADFGVTVNKIRSLVMDLSWGGMLDAASEIRKDTAVRYYLIFFKRGDEYKHKFQKLGKDEDAILTGKLMQNYPECFIIDLNRMLKKLESVK